MNRVRLAAAAIGAVFGFTLVWSGLSDPDVIRHALLLDDAYLYLLFASALATGALGLRLLRRGRARALLTGEPVMWESPPLERRHIVGSVLFGVGWAVSAACPGPIAAQVGSGVLWGLATFAGVLAGIKLFQLRQRPARPLILLPDD